MLDWLIPALLTMVVGLLATMALDIGDIKIKMATNAERNDRQDDRIRETRGRVGTLESHVYRYDNRPLPQDEAAD